MEMIALLYVAMVPVCTMRRQRVLVRASRIFSRGQCCIWNGAVAVSAGQVITNAAGLCCTAAPAALRSARPCCSTCVTMPARCGTALYVPYPVPYSFAADNRDCPGRCESVGGVGGRIRDARATIVLRRMRAAGAQRCLSQPVSRRLTMRRTCTRGAT